MMISLSISPMSVLVSENSGENIAAVPNLDDLLISEIDEMTINEIDTTLI
jgi:hypothetical protein